MRVVDAVGNELSRDLLPDELGVDLAAGAFRYYFEAVADPFGGGAALPQAAGTLDPTGGNKVQLFRTVPSTLPFQTTADVVVDEMLINPLPANTYQRHTEDNVVTPVPEQFLSAVSVQVDLPQTMGNPNIGVDLSATVASVITVTDSLALESAYPTTGSLLLLMRYAHQ